MAKLSREQQIRGLKKALKSSKTPKHLKPSMRRRLQNLKQER